MTTTGEILDFLQTLAPADMKESWDNVGLLCGRSGAPVTRVLVALDPFLPVCQEAQSLGAELIVTHHPLLFQTKSITDETETGRCLLYLAEHGISAINLHTNLDAAPGGVNDCLAEALGLEQVQVLVPAGTDGQGRTYGLGRTGVVQTQTVEQFIQTVKSSLGCAGLRFTDGGRPVRRVAVGGGACGGFLEQAVQAGCDAFVTGDVKYNAFADAHAMGITLIDAGHFATEQVVCPYLVRKLQAAFPALRVTLSRVHGDCIRFA